MPRIVLPEFMFVARRWTWRSASDVHHARWLVGYLVVPTILALSANTSFADEPVTIAVVGDAPPRSASETTVERDVIGAAPHRTAGDVLSLVPGMFLTQHGGQGKAYQLFYRGFDSIHGQDLEMWVGGTPVNEVSNLHGQGYADLHFVMPEVISRMHALPGAYDPRQGDFAVAGSVFLSLGLADPGFLLKTTLGSFGERRALLAYRPTDANEYTFAAFEAQSTDGFGPSRAARRTSGIGQVLYALTPKFSLRVLATTFASRFDSAGVLRQDEVELERVDRFAASAPKQGGFSSRHSLLFEFNHVEEDERATFAPYFVLRSFKLRQNFTGYLQDPDNGDNSQQIHEAFTLGATASYRKPLRILSSRDSIEAGVSLRADFIDQSQRHLADVNDRVLSTPVDAKVRATDAAGWLDFVSKPLPRLTLRAGLRLDGLAYAVEDFTGCEVRELAPAGGRTPAAVGGVTRSAMGAHLGKKATLDVRLGNGFRALASYGEGFRSPQARSLGEGERTPFVESKSGEFGVRHQSEMAHASVSVFHTRLSQDLVFDPVTTRNESVPGTARTGLTLDLVLRPVSWFVSSTSFTYTRAVFSGSDTNYKSGELLPYVPQGVMRTDISISHKFKTIRGASTGKSMRTLEGAVGWSTTALLRRPLPYGEMGNDIFLVDAKASIRFAELELNLDCFNLLGARWYDGQFSFASNLDRSATPSLVPAKHVTVGAPRTVLATLVVHLN